MSEPNVPPPPTEPPSNAPPPPPPPPPGGTSPGGGGQGSPNVLMLVLSYAWILALVPFLVEKEDPEVQWHAKHGLVIFGIEIALSIVAVVLTQIPFLGCFLWLVWVLIWVGLVILRIVCLVKALNGERYLIPGVSQYADRF